MEIPVEMVSAAFSHAYSQVRKRANIKGFRKGKIPDNVLDQYYEPDINFESLNHLINNTYSKVLDENKLAPVTQPKFDAKPLEKGKSYTYEVEIEVTPEYEVKNYLEIPLKKLTAEISDEEINNELKRIQESRARLKPADDENEIKDGLMATIDFEGTIDGLPFKGSSSKNYLFEYGKGHFLKDFEIQMAGIKKGEKRTIDVNYPADYFDKALQGKKAVFEVTLLTLHKKELPKLDDEFAKDLGKKDMDVVKKEVEEMIKKRKERDFRNNYSEEIMEYLAKKNKFEVPEGLIENEIKRTQKPKEEVEKSIRTQIILELIAKKESLQVEPKQVESHFQVLSRMYNQPIDKLKEHYRQQGLIPQLMMQMLLDKTLDFLTDKAKFKN